MGSFTVGQIITKNNRLLCCYLTENHAIHLIAFNICSAERIKTYKTITHPLCHSQGSNQMTAFCNHCTRARFYKSRLKVWSWNCNNHTIFQWKRLLKTKLKNNNNNISFSFWYMAKCRFSQRVQYYTRTSFVSMP